jgi:polyphosphate kinase 2 (PPK2 family)
MEQIRNFEKHITENGTMLKFFLHISKEEQRERLLRRLEEKNTIEVLSGDLKERERWDDYMQYYEEAINNTSTDYAPWYVIPADDKEMCRYIVGKIIWEEMQKHTDIRLKWMRN